MDCLFSTAINKIREVKALETTKEKVKVKKKEPLKHSMLEIKHVF